MTSWLRMAKSAQRHTACLAHTLGVPQLRSLVVLKRWRADGEPKQEYFQTQCFADFVTPETGNTILGEQVIANHDYHVRGLSLLEHTREDFIDTASSFWLDAILVNGVRSRGFACDLLTYRESALTLDLFLRKKPEER